MNTPLTFAHPLALPITIGKQPRHANPAHPCQKLSFNEYKTCSKEDILQRLGKEASLSSVLRVFSSSVRWVNGNLRGAGRMAAKHWQKRLLPEVIARRRLRSAPSPATASPRPKTLAASEPCGWVDVRGESHRPSKGLGPVERLESGYPSSCSLFRLGHPPPKRVKGHYKGT